VNDFTGINACQACYCLNVEEHKSKVKLADGTEVIIEHSVCPMCTREFISTPQIMRNDKAIKKARGLKI